MYYVYQISADAKAAIDYATMCLCIYTILNL